MRGICFYADLPGTLLADDKPLLPLRSTVKQIKKYADDGGRLNCIALLLGREHQCSGFTQEALVATFGHADSDTSLGSMSRDVLRKCRRIPEALARKLHPRLFARLDQED